MCAKLQIIDTDKILTVKIQGKSAQNIGALIFRIIGEPGARGSNIYL